MTSVERVQHILKENNTDAFLVTSPQNAFYLSKFESSNAVVLILRDKGYYFTDFRYLENAKNTISELEVVPIKNGVFSQAAEILKDHEAKEVAFEEGYVTCFTYAILKEKLKGFTLVCGSGALLKLRQIKQPYEIEAISKAQAICEKGFCHILKIIKEGVAEIEIAAELEYFMRKNGAQGTSFPTIVLSGKKTSVPHGTPGFKKVENGDFVLMDFGAKVDGYCSDMSRTVGVGYATEEQKKVYRIVKSAQQNALDGMKAGLTCQEADSLARDVIAKEGYGDCFGHSMGHGVGIDIHEDPRVAQGILEELQPGMVTSVEPGIYLEGKFGVRIEDLVVITQNGIKNLNSSVKELFIL